MKIIKTMNERDAKPFQINPEQAVDYLEHRGYYEKGTVEAIFARNAKTSLRTPGAFYDFEPEDKTPHVCAG